MGTAYFPHDCDSHADLKIQMLIDELGFEGLGRYYTVLEVMYPLKGGILDMDDERVVRVLERVLRCDRETLEQFFKTCVDVGLFIEDIWQSFHHVASKRVTETQESIDRKVRAGKASAAARNKSNEQ